MSEPAKTPSALSGSTPDDGPKRPYRMPPYLVQMTYRDDRMPETLQVSVLAVPRRVWQRVGREAAKNGSQSLSGSPDSATHNPP